MALSLRSPGDVRRLFSALGDVPLTHESGGLSVAEVDYELAAGLSAEEESDLDFTAWVMLGLVAVLGSYTAIKGYERSTENRLQWGLGWGAAGFFFPVPATLATVMLDAK